MNVSITNDMIVEEIETVALGLNSTDGQAVVTDTATLSILDYDGMSVRATGSLDSSCPSTLHTVLHVNVLLFDSHVSIPYMLHPVSW